MCSDVLNIFLSNIQITASAIKKRKFQRCFNPKNVSIRVVIKLSKILSFSFVNENIYKFLAWKYLRYNYWGYKFYDDRERKKKSIEVNTKQQQQKTGYSQI